MSKAKTSGLANIAKNTRKARAAHAEAPAAPPSQDRRRPEEVQEVQFSGTITRTSVALDSGVWDAVLDWSHLLTKRIRKTGKGRVVPKYLLTAALLAFREKPVEEQLELVRQVLP